MKLKEAVKEKIKNPEYHPEKYTEKFIAAKIIALILQILMLCSTFSIMFLIATKKVISSLTVMFACNNKLHLSSFKLFIVAFVLILIFIMSLTIILYLLNKVVRIKLTFKQALSIVISSYIYFTLASIIAAILFLLNLSYIGYIVIIAIFFLTQFNVYKTYYSLVEKHGKRFSFIVAIIYIITSIIIFAILNATLFNYINTLYTTIC